MKRHRTKAFSRVNSKILSKRELLQRENKNGDRGINMTVVSVYTHRYSSRLVIYRRAHTYTYEHWNAV